MAGQNAVLNVTFTSSGAGAVIGDAQAVQGAIDGITGKTVSVGYESHGGAAAAGDARSVGESYKAAHGAAADLGREATRTARATGDVGREARATRGHMQGLHDDVRAVGDALAAAGSRNALSSSAREAQRELGGARQAVGELESGAGKAALAVRQIAPSGGGGPVGGLKDNVIDMQKLEDGTWGVAEGMKAIGAAEGAKPFSWAGQSFEYTQGGKEAQAGNEARKARQAAAAGGGTPFTREAASETEEVGKSAQRASGHVMNLGHAFGMMQNAGWQLAAVGGAMAGVTGEAVSLSKSTAALGMNFEGMGNMLTRVEQQTARGGISTQLGNQDAQLRQSARTMTQELGPAIKASVGAVGALEQAKMGAWGDLGGNIEQFANTLKSSAPGVQSIMTSLGQTALGLGGDVATGLVQAAPAFQSLAQSVAGNSAGITAGAKALTELGVGAVQVGTEGLSIFGQVDTAVKSVVQPGGQPGADSLFNTAMGDVDKFLGARRNPTTGNLESIGNFGDYDNDSTVPNPKSPAAAGYAKAQSASSDAPKLVASGGFDPNKSFSGAAIMPDGSTVYGTGTDASERKAAAVARGQDALKTRTAADRAQAEGPNAGKSAAQIYSDEYKAATGAAPGAPRYSGLGAPPAGLGGGAGAAETPHQRAVRQSSEAASRGPSGAPPAGGLMGSGPGSSAGSISAHAQALQTLRNAYQQTGQSAQSMSTQTSSAANSLGQSTQTGAQRAAQSMHSVPRAIASAAPAAAVSGAQVGASMGSGMAQGSQRSESVTDSVMRRHISKVTDTASGAAQAGGKSIGAAMGAGTATGVSQTQTVTDNVVRKHVKKIVDVMADALGIKSPSRVTAQTIGAPMMQGVGVGFAGEAANTGGVVAAGLGQVSSGAQGVASDLGLKVGNVYGQSIVDGTAVQLQKSLLQSEGLPSGLGAASMINLAGTGLVNAGSGASTWKANPGAASLVTFGGNQQMQITVNLDGQQLHQQMYDIANSQAEIQVNTAVRQLTNTMASQRG